MVVSLKVLCFQTDFRQVHEKLSAAIQREEERHGEGRRQPGVSPKYSPMVPPSSSVVQVNVYFPENTPVSVSIIPTGKEEIDC